MDHNQDMLPNGGSLSTDAYDHDGKQQPYSQYLATNSWPAFAPAFDQSSMDPSSVQQNAADSGDSQDPMSSGRSETIATMSSLGIRTSMPSTSPMTAFQTLGFPGFSQSFDPSSALVTTSDLQYDLLSGQHHGFAQNNTAMNPMAFTGNFGISLQASPIDDFMPTTTSQEQIHNSLASSYSMGFVPTAPLDNMFQLNGMSNDLSNMLGNQAFMNAQPTGLAIPSSNFSSPTENWLDARSLSSSSDNSWTLIDHMSHNRQAMNGFANALHSGVVSPQNLHVRTDSNSSRNSDGAPLSAASVGSFEEIFHPSPEPEFSTFASSQSAYQSSANHSLQHSPASHHSPLAVVPIPGPSIAPKTSKNTSTSSSSPSSSSPPSTASSPKSRRRTSPVGVTPKVISKKKTTGVGSAKEKSEKKIGRRRGPLKPEQRQQAHEIRKLGACLRCKFLKKVCDKGEPCGGCQPAHARLWQVPCTRIDIKDIAYFLKDYKTDYERHVSLEFSVTNIKDFSKQERYLYISHGYGYSFPLSCREVYVHDDSCFGIDWVENTMDNANMQQFETSTMHLSAGAAGVPKAAISEYLDMHLDHGFEKFVDDYFEGTPFLSQILKTIFRFNQQAKMPVLRKGLKLVIAYALTLHITLINGLTEEEQELGKVDDESSRYHGSNCAPVMINFQVKRAMADAWRELMKEVLEELSSLYQSVYSGDKLKNWPTIFMVATLILAIWEMMQFDVNYRSKDESYIQKFCNEMESVPVGVIVGLFCAISTKLPSFLEWDSRKHSNVLNNNTAVCNLMTEVRKNVEKHESYLRKQTSCKFDRNNFDCLSNKFLSKLVVRAN